MVTDFKLSADGQMVTVRELLKALNAFCGKLAEEYDFSTVLCREAHVPEKYWRLVAFAVEGNNEGYYVHVGAILSTERSLPTYLEFGLAKTYSSESAYDDNTYDGAPDAGHQIVGSGETEAEAVADFQEQWNEAQRLELETEEVFWCPRCCVASATIQPEHVCVEEER
jgi:hypothetical protein